MRTHHISLLTENVDRNFHFYTEILGLRFIKNSVNQAKPLRRHIYYGDFLGTPGTVVTFFPIDHFHERFDGLNFFSGIHFSVPTGSIDFWKMRLANLDIKSNLDDKGRLHFVDYDNIPIRLQETNKVNFDWHINRMSDVDADFQITGVVGAEMHVPDIDKTIKFFDELLEIKTYDNIIKLDDGEALELIPTDKNTEKSKFGWGSTDHYALGVESESDLKYFWNKAKKLGYTQELFVDRGYFKSAYFIEPNGNRVELATNNPGFTLDESILELGTTFALPPKFESQRELLLEHYAKKNVSFNQVKPYISNENMDEFKTNFSKIDGKFNR